MIIQDLRSTNRHAPKQDQARCLGDKIDMEKFNKLPGPVTARMLGGSEYWIETLDVQTGCMRIDVCGQIDHTHFGEVTLLIDQDGNEHDPDDFWLEA